MGEITEMIMDGTLCDVCGAVFDDIVEGKVEPGHPRTCDDCK